MGACSPRFSTPLGPHTVLGLSACGSLFYRKQTPPVHVFTGASRNALIRRNRNPASAVLPRNIVAIATSIMRFIVINLRDEKQKVLAEQFREDGFEVVFHDYIVPFGPGKSIACFEIFNGFDILFRLFSSFERPAKSLIPRLF